MAEFNEFFFIPMWSSDEEYRGFTLSWLTFPDWSFRRGAGELWDPDYMQLEESVCDDVGDTPNAVLGDLKGRLSTELDDLKQFSFQGSPPGIAVATGKPFAFMVYFEHDIDEYFIVVYSKAHVGDPELEWVWHVPSGRTLESVYARLKEVLLPYLKEQMVAGGAG